MEITLRKAKSEEKIGLTVSYSSANGSGSDDTETCTEVFITDIIPESLAAKDGRLRSGDQILQVNGRDVTTKEETESLFAENKNAVTLLVSRCIYSGEHDLLEPCDFLDEEVAPPSPSSLLTNPKIPVPINKHLTDSNRLSSGKLILSADDPLHHTNIKAQMEAMNQEIAALDFRMETAFLSKSQPTNELSNDKDEDDTSYHEPVDGMNEKTNDLPVSLVQEIKRKQPPQLPAFPSPPNIDSDTEHIYETIPEDSEPEPIYCSPYEGSDQSVVEQWLKMNSNNQNQHQNTNALLALMKQKVGFANVSRVSPQQESKVWQKTTKSNSSGEDHENSSSAYNTGGSCNSNHLTLELNFSPDKDISRSTMVLQPQKLKEKELTNGTSINDNCKQCTKNRKDKLSPKHTKSQVIPTSNSINMYQTSSHPTTPVTPSAVTDFKEKVSSKASTMKNTSSSVPTTTMYTNMANLQQTMLLQQRMFRQALFQQNTISNTKHYTAPNLSQYQFVSGQQIYRTSLQPRTNEENMVWKVKRRQDGSRYIVRRPVSRTKLLKDRAVKIAEERHELTTEDDTISEIKLGRYWNKEERKKHMEKSKERRNRQEAMIVAKNQQIHCDDNKYNGGGQMHTSFSGGHVTMSRINGLPPTIPKSKSSETNRKSTTFGRKKNNNREDSITPDSNDKGSSIVNAKVGILSVTTV